MSANEDSSIPIEKGIQHLVNPTQDRDYYKQLHQMRPDFKDISLEKLTTAGWRAFTNITQIDESTPQSEYAAKYSQFLNKDEYRPLEQLCLCPQGNPITIIDQDLNRIIKPKCME